MTASHGPPFPSGSGCPQTEVTSLREATLRGSGLLLGLRTGSAQGGTLWRLERQTGGLRTLPSLYRVSFFLKPKAGGLRHPHTPPSGRGVRSINKLQLLRTLIQHLLPSRYSYTHQNQFPLCGIEERHWPSAFTIMY